MSPMSRQSGCCSSNEEPSAFMWSLRALWDSHSNDSLRRRRDLMMMMEAAHPLRGNPANEPRLPDLFTPFERVRSVMSLQSDAYISLRGKCFSIQPVAPAWLITKPSRHESSGQFVGLMKRLLRDSSSPTSQSCGAHSVSFSELTVSPEFTIGFERLVIHDCDYEAAVIIRDEQLIISKCNCLFPNLYLCKYIIDASSFPCALFPSLPLRSYFECGGDLSAIASHALRTNRIG